MAFHRHRQSHRQKSPKVDSQLMLLLQALLWECSRSIGWPNCTITSKKLVKTRWLTGCAPPPGQLARGGTQPKGMVITSWFLVRRLIKVIILWSSKVAGQKLFYGLGLGQKLFYGLPRTRNELKTEGMWIGRRRHNTRPWLRTSPKQSPGDACYDTNRREDARITWLPPGSSF